MMSQFNFFIVINNNWSKSSSLLSHRERIHVLWGESFFFLPLACPGTLYFTSNQKVAASAFTLVFVISQQLIFLLLKDVFSGKCHFSIAPLACCLAPYFHLLLFWPLTVDSTFQMLFQTVILFWSLSKYTI